MASWCLWEVDKHEFLLLVGISVSEALGFRFQDLLGGFKQTGGLVPEFHTDLRDLRKVHELYWRHLQVRVVGGGQRRETDAGMTVGRGDVHVGGKRFPLERFTREDAVGFKPEA